MFIDTSTDINNFQDISGGGGISIFKHIGNTSGNITLEKNKITTAHFTGNHTVTLPTVTSSQQVTCILDFTTTNTSYPSITNTNVFNAVGISLVPSATAGSALTITGASNSTPIEITVTSHGYKNGDTVLIASVGGNTAANGTFIITKTGDNTFTLNGTTGNGAYTSGGTSSKYVTRNRYTFTSAIGSDCWEVDFKQFGGSEVSFTQPVLSANGTLGGSSFAVALSSEYSTGYAYKAFDNNSSTFGQSATITGSFTIYNPAPIKVSNLAITNVNGTNPEASAGRAWTIEGSNDNTNWVSLTSGTNTTLTPGSAWNAAIASGSQGYYKYYKLTGTSDAASFFAAAEIGITAMIIL